MHAVMTEDERGLRHSQDAFPSSREYAKDHEGTNNSINLSLPTYELLRATRAGGGGRKRNAALNLHYAKEFCEYLLRTDNIRGESKRRVVGTHARMRPSSRMGPGRKLAAPAFSAQYHTVLGATMLPPTTAFYNCCCKASILAPKANLGIETHLWTTLYAEPWPCQLRAWSL